jgi:hypothetical protein
MDDLAARDALLEYWFWKVNLPNGGAIVDYIVRRERAEAELRVSTWLDGVRPVTHHFAKSWTSSIDGIRIEDANLSSAGSRGVAGGVSWDLDWDLGADRLAPRPAWFGPLHPYDLEIIVRPAATVRGTLTIDGQEVRLDGPAGVSHYWGRRLPARWTWISVTGFDDEPDARLEADFAYTTLWGRGPATPAGWVWLRSGGRTETTIMPLTGVISARSDGLGIRLSSLRVDGRRHTLECSAGAEAFNDADEGIRQTMLADLSLDGRRRATGSVGLEFRDERRLVSA